MKYFLLLSIFLLTSFLSFSQVKNFDLSKYKLPDIKRHQMDFFFYTDGNSNSTTTQRNEDTGEDAYESKSRDFEGNADVSYTYYRNSELFQSSINSNIKLNGTLTDRLAPWTDKELVTFFNPYLDFSYDVNMFNRKNNWFFKTAPAFYVSYWTKNISEGENEQKINSFNVNGTLKLGIGIGRIEQVQDFRHAVLIVKELKERNVLVRNITENEIVELATLISELKNKRFFDYRKRKEEELTAIHSFFIKKRLVSGNSISYFTGLNDMWSFGSNSVRESGNQFLFAVTPRYSFGRDENSIDDNNEVIKNSVTIQYNLSYVSKKPVSIKWQRDFAAGVGQNYTKTDKEIIGRSNEDEKKYNSRIFASGVLRFYPDTRTSFSFSISPKFGNFSSEKVMDKENYYFSFDLSTGAYYYISERLRVSYAIIYRHYVLHIFNDDVPNLNRNYFYYRFSFDYAIF